MIAGIIAFLQALPRLLDLTSRLGNWMITNNIQGWMNNLEGHIDQLEKAKTADEKLNAAKNLAGMIKGL